MSVKNGLPDAVLGDLYPFEDKYVDLADGRRMHYIEQGRAGLRRPTILLLHGNPTWSFLYRRFMAPLSRVARVIAVDHMGFGRSDHPKDPSYYTLERHIANLEEFCAVLGLKRVIPVVQDWGGPIGLGFAARHPDKIAGLVILNTWAFTTRGTPKLPVWFKVLTRGKVGDFVMGSRNAFVEQLMPKLLVAPTTERIMDGYRHPFPNKESRAGVVAFPRMIPTSDRHPDWDTMDTIEQALPRLDVPAIILWGTKDPAFSKSRAHLFHELLPRALAPIWFDEAGHYLQEDIPGELTAEIIDFVKSV